MGVRPQTLHALSVCSGVGGLDVGLHVALPQVKTVCYVEGEANAAATLVRRMGEGAMDEAPIWTDVRTFDAKPWRGKVDIIVGGYPCQPFSLAGKMRGEKDPRHLWPYIAGHVASLRPSLCFFENVAGHLRLGFKKVHDDLQGMGYGVAAGMFKASEVGATHGRERLFILAVENANLHRLQGVIAPRPEGGAVELSSGTELAEPYGGERGRSRPVEKGARQRISGDSVEDGERVADARRQSGDRHRGLRAVARQDEREEGTRPGKVRDAPRGGVENMADDGQAVEVGAPAGLGAFPPIPTDDREWSFVFHHAPWLAPALPKRKKEPASEAKSTLRGMAHGVAHRVDRLRACGNGVVPLQAAYAFTVLRGAFCV